MAIRLLYIEDDEIDLLTLRRALSNEPAIELHVSKSYVELKKLRLDSYDYILCDSNLPDADFVKLKSYLGGEKNVQFVSGYGVDGDSVWVKPISIRKIYEFINFYNTISLNYVESIAQGDKEFEMEMFELAIEVLQERKVEFLAAQGDLPTLRTIAHSSKSSFRVCGMSIEVLDKLEELTDLAYSEAVETSLISEIIRSIDKGLSELTHLISVE